MKYQLKLNFKFNGVIIFMNYFILIQNKYIKNSEI